MDQMGLIKITLIVIVVIVVSTISFVLLRKYKIAGPITKPENEQKCITAGWQKVTLNVSGQERQLFWRGPEGSWNKGAIIVMHGGGGSYTHWCYASHKIVKPQVDFSALAIARGFAVFLLDSTNDVVTDANNLPCGKRFDATVVDSPRANVDLPFIEKVLTEIIPAKRPSGSAKEIFMTGESTGGFMTVRAATHFDNLIAAFAPAAAADPYGTYFDCNPALSPRTSAKGVGYDRETKRPITEVDACKSDSYQNEKEWETTGLTLKPFFKTFHHEDDGVADISCREKVGKSLNLHGYQDAGAYVIKSSGERSVAAHLWQSEYNQPILEFFMRNVDTKK